jgi:hypothetical protein
MSTDLLLQAREQAAAMLFGPPPQAILRAWPRRWLSRSRFMPYAEAEAWHLRQAAKLALSSMLRDERKQAEHLRQAELNRAWRWRQDRGLLEDFRYGENPRPPTDWGLTPDGIVDGLEPPNQGSGARPPRPEPSLPLKKFG